MNKLFNIQYHLHHSFKHYETTLMHPYCETRQHKKGPIFFKDSTGFGVDSPLDLDNCGTEKEGSLPELENQELKKKKQQQQTDL
jgi:hypothetical protein